MRFFADAIYIIEDKECGTRNDEQGILNDE
jgi:hypothetical protein